jgi:hypothetical protein
VTWRAADVPRCKCKRCLRALDRRLEVWCPSVPLRHLRRVYALTDEMTVLGYEIWDTFPIGSPERKALEWYYPRAALLIKRPDLFRGRRRLRTCREWAERDPDAFLAWAMAMGRAIWGKEPAA